MNDGFKKTFLRESESLQGYGPVIFLRDVVKVLFVQLKLEKKKENLQVSSGKKGLVIYGIVTP